MRNNYRRSNQNEPPKYEYCVSRGLEDLARKPPRSANPALLLDKYVGGRRGNKGDLELGKGWLKDFVGLYQAAGQEANLRKGFAGYHERWKALLKQEQAATRELQTVWRLAIHLGRGSVIENGSILLHRTLGFPYLPGQGLKGLARAYAEANLPPERVKVLFGTQEQEGALVFFEAIPARWPELKVDILNPHFGEWYNSGGRSRGPTDDQKPVPVYFLTVAGGTPFLFGVGLASHWRNNSAAQGWAQEGLEVLAAALNEMGAGAKTAAGYGQFAEG